MVALSVLLFTVVSAVVSWLVRRCAAFWRGRSRSAPHGRSPWGLPGQGSAGDGAHPRPTSPDSSNGAPSPSERDGRRP